jgi:hypothetical protein
MPDGTLNAYEFLTDVLNSANPDGEPRWIGVDTGNAQVLVFTQKGEHGDWRFSNAVVRPRTD